MSGHSTTRIRVHRREPEPIITTTEESSWSEGDDSRPSEEEDEDDWAEFSEDDVDPEDSASTHPASHHRSRSQSHRPPLRRHKLSTQTRPQSQFGFQTPNPPTSLDSSDYYDYGHGGFQPPGGPPFYPGRGSQPHGYAQSHAGGYAPPYHNQTMVPYGPPGYNNPFAPAPMNSNGGTYFNGEHGRGGWNGPQEVMTYGSQNYFGQPYPVPHAMQQYQWSPPPPPPTEAPKPRTPAPAPAPEPPKEDPEKEAMKKRLAEIEAEAKRKEDEAKQKELEARIREEAELTFQRKMEQMKRDEEIRANERRIALEKAKKEIEDARKDAERAARDAVEAERKAEAERAKREADAFARAQRDARDKMEAERKAEEERKKKEAEAAAAAEAAAKLKLEAAIRAEADAKAAADKKAAEEAAWRKNLEDEAKIKAEIEARKKIEDEKKAAEDAKAAEEQKKKEDEAFKKKALEEAKAKAEEASKKAKDNAPLRFKDAVGRKFSFPFHLCRTWQGMEELIKQAFVHVDVIGNHVQAGHYDLIGPNGEIILPQVWEKVIEPDWAVTMHMWPMERPGPPPGMAGRGQVPGGAGPNPMHPGLRQASGHPAHAHGRPPIPPAGPRMDGPFARPSGGPPGGGRGPMIPPNVHIIQGGKPREKKPSKGQSGMLSWMVGSKPKSSSKK